MPVLPPGAWLSAKSAEAWAKYTGAADYDQPLHRDYLNHTLMVPADDPRFRQLEMFVYLVDVPEEPGPPSMLSRTRTAGLPADRAAVSRAGYDPVAAGTGRPCLTSGPDGSR